MQLKITTDYAIRMILYLAQNESVIVSASFSSFLLFDDEYRKNRIQTNGSNCLKCNYFVRKRSAIGCLRRIS